MTLKWDSASYSAGDFRLFYDAYPAPILVDTHDFDVVSIAAGHLAADVERVTGSKPAVVTSDTNVAEHLILAGTLGHSAWIDRLVEQRKLDTTRLAGLWESFLIAVVDQPQAGVERGLVIVGSDRRGTAYGIFELSERIGDSPWYWWADVRPAQRSTIVVSAGTELHGPPAVKYRGIFINDEDWSLREWASMTFAPEEAAEQKGLGPKTYEKIFELLLRLRANLLWPAMHPGTKPFNDYPENKVLADRYAIVMGSSHCEPMLRNNVGEWDFTRNGEWNFKTNRDAMLTYWTDRVRENGQYENIYTLGMRGIHDDPMPGREPLSERVTRLAQVIEAQRDILRRQVNPDTAAVPQILCVYKEVLDLYRGGLALPADVTVVWSDDNYGYITNLPSPAEHEQRRKAGVYYHISYWGRPYDYLWLCTTPLALIWSEMHKAYGCGAREFWVLNVGGLKAHEIGMEFFLRLAWNADTWDADSPRQFLTRWAEREFGVSEPEVVADLLTEYYRLGFVRKPEHMGWNRTYPDTQNRRSEFSPVNYGDEVQRRLDEYEALVRDIDAIYAALPDERRDAFYQLVVYPARCASLMNQKYLLAQKSRFYAVQGRASTTRYAARMHHAFEAIHTETDYYNNQLTHGKWQHVMCDHPRDLPVFAMPLVSNYPQPLTTRLGVVVEGAELPDSLAGQHGMNHSLPTFYAGERQFVDLYNTGDTPFFWTATPSAAWIQLSDREGTLESEHHLWVSIDWEAAPNGEKVSGQIILSGTGVMQTVEVNLADPPSLAEGIFEANGCVSVHAAHFTSFQTTAHATLQIIPGLGRTGEAVAIFAPDGAECEPVDGMPDFVAILDYRMYLAGGGSYVTRIYCLPTHPIHDGCGQRYSVSFDEQSPQVVDIATRGGEQDKAWQENVLRGAALGTTRHTINTPGWHTLRIRVLDAGVVLDKIIIDAGGERPSYLGPPETIRRT